MKRDLIGTSVGSERSEAIGWNACIDHLASAGYLRAPLPRIEGLKEGLDATYRANKEWERQTGVEIPDTAKAVISAAESYLKASEV